MLGLPDMETHTGACHCKKVRYQATLDLSKPVLECNCSLCAVKGILWQFVPAESFTLLEGEEYLKEYLFNKQMIRHQFCTECGVEPFAYGENNGEKVVALNVRSIEGIDLDALERTKVDGKSF